MFIPIKPGVLLKETTGWMVLIGSFPFSFPAHPQDLHTDRVMIGTTAGTSASGGARGPGLADRRRGRAGRFGGCGQPSLGRGAAGRGSARGDKPGSASGPLTGTGDKSSAVPLGFVSFF